MSNIPAKVIILTVYILSAQGAFFVMLSLAPVSECSLPMHRCYGATAVNCVNKINRCKGRA